MKQADACGYSYGVVGAMDCAGFGVPVIIAAAALDAVLVIQADVEPDGRIERAVLMQAQPGEVAIEVLAVFAGGEVAVGDAPVGDRAGDAVNHLADAVFAFGRARFAVEIFADDDVGRQGAPGLGDSQSVCSNRTSPYSSLIWAVRMSQETVSKGS